MKFIVDPWDTVVREPWRQKLPEYLMDGARIKKVQVSIKRRLYPFAYPQEFLGPCCTILLVRVFQGSDTAGDSRDALK